MRIFSIIRLAPFLGGCCLFLLAAASAQAQYLFDATSAEMAGNADWVIDANSHNLDVTSGNGSGTLGGNDSNPQRIPSPAASGITASTPETYWTGALSAWGVSLVQKGKTVESLPYDGSITYGNASNPQDLSHYKVFVLDEPNILFTAAEKTAIMTFVKNGGGLFMISDHGGSDRNNDGADSVDVLNDLMTNNTVKANAFGISFNGDDVSPSSPSVDTSSADPLTRGALGNVTGYNFADGSTMMLSTSQNSTVQGAIWSSSSRTSSNVMAAYGYFGAGRFVAVGDSSPFDDGTGDPNDILYNGWTDGGNFVNGFANDGRFAMNASLWLVPEPGSATLFALGALPFFFGRRRGAKWRRD